jgi:hypothetical protein
LNVNVVRNPIHWMLRRANLDIGKGLSGSQYRSVHVTYLLDCYLPQSLVKRGDRGGIDSRLCVNDSPLREGSLSTYDFNHLTYLMTRPR